MQQGRKEQLERRTFDLPSSSTGRMWEEERRQRKKECVKDSRMSHSWGGVGAWAVWGAGCSLSPTRHVGVSWAGDRIPLARMIDTLGVLHRVVGAKEWGPRDWASAGVPQAVPLRAFFCSFSVSEDFFLISCLARLYSVQRQEGGYSKGFLWRGSGNPRKTPLYLSRGPCPVGWLTSSSLRCAPAVD